MTLQECAEKEGEISIEYNPETNKWYWFINGGGDGQVSSKEEYDEPNDVLKYLYNFLDWFTGFYGNFRGN